MHHTGGVLVGQPRVRDRRTRGKALIESGPDLAPLPHLGQLAARWTGDSSLEHPWLLLEDGNVYTKNPNESLVAKMMRIAERLGAIVQGDDGEAYAPSESVTEPASSDSPKRPAHRGLLGRIAGRLGSAQQVTIAHVANAFGVSGDIKTAR